VVEHELAVRIRLHVARGRGDQIVAIPQREMQRRPAPVLAQAATGFEAGEKGSINNLKGRIEKGHVHGCDLVIQMCTMNAKELLEIRDLAFKHGAKSVTFADGPVDARGQSLLNVTANRNKHLLDGKTVGQFMQASAELTIKNLEAVRDARAPKAEFEERFGTKALKLFEKDGKFEPALIKDVIDKLKADILRFKPHVDRGKERVPGVELALGAQGQRAA